MSSTEVFKNLDKEFREALTNFVYDKLNSKFNYNIKATEISTYLTERYSINRDETFIENLINYIMDIDTGFKNEIIKKVKELIIKDKALND